jgi:hypothetical protein
MSVVCVMVISTREVKFAFLPLSPQADNTLRSRGCVGGAGVR